VPFRKWLGDYIEDTFHLDSRLLRSLWLLLRKPGALTLAYIEGQRSSYVRPFRLYLAASFLYFLTLSLLPARSGVEIKLDEPLPAASVLAPGSAGGTQSPPPTVPKLKENTYFKRQLNRFIGQGQEAAQQQVLHVLVRTLPKAMFVLVPVFALLVHLLYRRAGRFYAEHFLFALHFHAFAFFTLTAFILVPLTSLRPVGQLLITLYLFLSLRRVYGQPLVRTGLKAVLLMVSYGVLLLFSVVAATLASIYRME
jgi:hypothetical protein